ncbi:MAG: phage tail tape measure protein [Oscillospiraceae bacterium]|nr:phage tail tape measure protein [Oscillospiraceae bacterium]
MRSGLSVMESYVSHTAADITAQIITAISSAFAEIPKQITALGSGFESSMAQVVATMGISKASEEFDILSDKAKEMGEDTKFSASEAGDALNYLALAGYSAEKSCAALPTVLNVAAAGGIDLAAASDMVTDSMSALGVSMDELENFSDKLAKTSQKSNTSVAQLGAAIISVGANARVLQGGTTELMTELGILADSGLKSAEAGTALARVIKNLSTPTQVSADELARLGVSCYDAEGNFRNMQDIFQDLNKAMEGFTAEEVQNSLAEIFDTAALSSAKVLLAESGDRFNELSGYLEDCDGAAAQMAKTMSDTLTGDIDNCSSALEGLAITAYDKFSGTMRTAIQAVTADVGTLNSSLKDGELSQAADKISSAFSSAVASVSALLADDVVPAVITGFSAIVEHGNEIIAVAVGIGAAVAGMKIASEITYAVSAFHKAQQAISMLALSTNIATLSATQLTKNLTLSQIAVGALTGEISLVTAAQAAWNAVTNVNPWVALATVVIAAGAAIAVYSVNAMKATEATENAVSAVEAADDSLKSLSESVEENTAENKKNQDELKNKIAIYEELRKSYEATGQGEEQLKQITEEIQALSPTTIKFIDEETGAYLSLADSIDDVIAAMERKRNYDHAESSWNTAKDNLDSLYKQQKALLDDEEQLNEEYGNATTLAKMWWIDNKIKENRDAQIAVSEAILENEKIIADSEQKIKDYYSSPSGAESTSAIDYSAVEAERRAKEEKERVLESQKRAVKDREKALAAMEEEWSRAEHNYNVGLISSDEELYAKKAEIWAKYGDKSLEEHWAYQEDLIALGKELSDEERRTAEEAAEKRLASEEEAARKSAQLRQEEWDNIAKAENLGAINSEKAYKKRLEWIEKYCPEYSEEWYDYYKTVYDYEVEFERQRVEDVKNILDEELSAVKSNIDAIADEYKTAYSDIENNMQSYRKKLLSVGGDVFEVTETENEDGSKTKSYKVNDIKAQIDLMKRYHEALVKMRDSGASASLLSEMMSLDPEDGIQMADYMLSSGDFSKINELYKEREAVAAELAQDFYAPEIAALNADTVEKISAEYGALPTELQAIGQLAIINLGKGMDMETDNLFEHISANVDRAVQRAETVIDNYSSGGLTADISEDMTAKGKADGEAYAAGFEEGVGSISAQVEAEVNTKQTAAASGQAQLSQLDGLLKGITSAIKDIRIFNTITSRLDLDKKTIAQAVNEYNSTLGRVSDSYD